jgi:signal transduction histidine kinase
MFKNIRRKLTLFYTMLMAFFLFGFVGVTYGGLLWAVYSEEKQEILMFAEEEAKEHLIILKNKEVLRTAVEEDDYSGRMFYYAYDNNGQRVNVAEPHPDLRAVVKNRIENWNTVHGKAFLLTFTLPDGNTAYVMMASMPIREGSDVYGTVYVGRDVTTYYLILRKLLYILGAVSLLFLILMSGAGYIMARKAMEPIKQSFERQREFVADASHELRTPLSVLLTSVDAVQRDEVSQMSLFSQQVLADMKDEINKMSKIVSDLLTLARADVAVLNLLKRQFDVVMVAGQCVRSLQALAQKKNIDLSLEAPGQVLVYADKERIGQLILILLDNAIKYTGERGFVRFVLQMQSRGSRELILRVQDSGIGIQPEYHDLIFERFYRVDKVRSREVGGTGLGLSIAKWIVEAHGGTIRVESQVGHGTSFIVTLPQ